MKIDCMWTEDDLRFKRLGLPVAVGLSKDMCPITMPSTMWMRCSAGQRGRGRESC